MKPIMTIAINLNLILYAMIVYYFANHDLSIWLCIIALLLMDFVMCNMIEPFLRGFFGKR